MVLCFQSEKMICDWKHKGEVWVEFVFLIVFVPQKKNKSEKPQQPREPNPVGEIGSEVERLGLSFRSCFSLPFLGRKVYQEDIFMLSIRKKWFVIESIKARSE